MRVLGVAGGFEKQWSLGQWRKILIRNVLIGFGVGFGLGARAHRRYGVGHTRNTRLALDTDPERLNSGADVETGVCLGFFALSLLIACSHATHRWRRARAAKSEPCSGRSGRPGRGSRVHPRRPSPPAIAVQTTRRSMPGAKPDQMLAFFRHRAANEGRRARARVEVTRASSCLASSGASGKVYGQNSPFILERFANVPWTARLSKPLLANVVRVDREFDDPLPPEASELGRRADRTFLSRHSLAGHQPRQNEPSGVQGVEARRRVRHRRPTARCQAAA